MMLKILSFLLFLAIMVVNVADANWDWVNAKPQKFTLSDEYVIAVGTAVGTIEYDALTTVIKKSNPKTYLVTGIPRLGGPQIVRASDIEKALTEGKEIRLYNVKIIGDINYNGEIRRTVYFIDVEFSGNVYFWMAKFLQEAFFDGARFTKGVSFNYSEFYKEASFKATSFSGERNYINCQDFDQPYGAGYFGPGFAYSSKFKFPDHAVTQYVYNGETFKVRNYEYDLIRKKIGHILIKYLPGSTNFFFARFFGKVDFTRAHLSFVCFQNAEFNEIVYFNDSSFRGTCSFWGCTFMKTSYFWRCQYDKTEETSLCFDFVEFFSPMFIEWNNYKQV